MNNMSVYSVELSQQYLFKNNTFVYNWAITAPLLFNIWKALNEILALPWRA